MAVQPLTEPEIEERLSVLPAWRAVDDHLVRSYRLASHKAAAALVAEVARVQDELDHHSDLTLGYDTVDVSVNTHSVGGRITALDVELADRIEELAARHDAH
ncbi:4a-hydroxytetrahydrobiopterin dehydratase [Streptomyces sp. NPDC002734]|uniref:4a-hydroxytetrahydrobiopterin dehydratase n=1 Tax=Streptomyces sp. NPDC002734 TaxID=3154426 RepID=UPI003319603B